MHKEKNSGTTTDFAMPHHGSMSREMRFDVEDKLKKGKISAVIARLLRTLSLLPPSAMVGAIALDTVNIRTSGITRLCMSSSPARLKLVRELMEGAPDMLGIASLACATIPAKAMMISVMKTRSTTIEACMVRQSQRKGMDTVLRLARSRAILLAKGEACWPACPAEPPTSIAS